MRTGGEGWGGGKWEGREKGEGGKGERGDGEGGEIAPPPRIFDKFTPMPMYCQLQPLFISTLHWRTSLINIGFG